MKKALILVAAFFLGLPLVTWLSAQMSLDRSLQHTRATQALPLFSSGTVDGLVRIPANGFEFRARIAGFDSDGPALVLLHGFPSTSLKWSHLIERAAAAGYRVIAYDQRGFSPGARPEEIAAYRVERVAEDIFAVADAVGFDEFHLVGHDWGALVGWFAVGSRPERVLSLTALSIPHPWAIAPPDIPSSHPAYVKVFRQPGVAEAFLGFGNRWLLHRVVWPPMSDANRAEYEALYSEPGALEATLGLYRAMDTNNKPDFKAVTRPVLHLYGRNDMAIFISDKVQSRLSQWVDGELTVKAFDAGHWLIEEREAEIVEHIMSYLERHR